jgi:hypothetical protein
VALHASLAGRRLLLLLLLLLLLAVVLVVGGRLVRVLAARGSGRRLLSVGDANSHACWLHSFFGPTAAAAAAGGGEGAGSKRVRQASP